MDTFGEGSSREPHDGHDHEDVIRVHELTEFIFCPRAGLAQFEDGRTEERYVGAGRQDYLPEWEIIDIRSHRLSLIRQIRIVVASLVVFEALSALFAFFIHSVYAFIAVAGAVVVILALVPRLKAFLALDSRHNEYLRTRPSAPPTDLPDDMPINWWAMLKDGFDSLPSRDMVAPELGIRAAPHRILRKGGLAIPAFLYRGEYKGVRYQDRARIVAYCRLVEARQDAQAPYGIILKSGSYVAIAVPNDNGAKDILDRELANARKIICDSREGRPDPDPPQNPSKCEKCPVGRPRRYDPRQPQYVRNGEPLKMVLLEDKQKRLYHSLCGDRFEWIPPHEIAKRNGWA